MSGSAHKTLGISSNASAKDIKQAYRKASLKTHPDVKGGSKEAFNKVNDAYNALINNTNHSRVNPHRRAPTHQDGTYTSSDNTTASNFGTRGKTTFHTPNPYRHATASTIKGSQQTMGTYHFDERIGVQTRTRISRAQVLKASQRTHTRLNFWVCTIPLVAAYGLYEYNLAERRQALVQNARKGKRKKNRG
jgi:DnaJ-class molecular chaperone|tara:strand:- start:127 stop:699 length:573 start_codon:yes stop_codon:yes gene_type:complete